MQKREGKANLQMRARGVDPHHGESQDFVIYSHEGFELSYSPLFLTPTFLPMAGGRREGADTLTVEVVKVTSKPPRRRSTTKGKSTAGHKQRREKDNARAKGIDSLRHTAHTLLIHFIVSASAAVRARSGVRARPSGTSSRTVMQPESSQQRISPRRSLRHGRRE